MNNEQGLLGEVAGRKKDARSGRNSTRPPHDGGTASHVDTPKQNAGGGACVARQSHRAEPAKGGAHGTRQREEEGHRRTGTRG